MQRDEYYDAALKFCQDHGYQGDHLPGFRPGPTSSNCPIAVALDAKWEWTDGTRQGKPFSARNEVEANLLRGFVNKADCGEYAELGRPHE